MVWVSSQNTHDKTKRERKRSDWLVLDCSVPGSQFGEDQNKERLLTSTQQMGNTVGKGVSMSHKSCFFLFKIELTVKIKIKDNHNFCLAFSQNYSQCELSARQLMITVT